MLAAIEGWLEQLDSFVVDSWTLIAAAFEGLDSLFEILSIG
jgi:hypothetical protein